MLGVVVSWGKVATIFWAVLPQPPRFVWCSATPALFTYSIRFAGEWRKPKSNRSGPDASPLFLTHRQASICVSKQSGKGDRTKSRGNGGRSKRDGETITERLFLLHYNRPFLAQLSSYHDFLPSLAAIIYSLHWIRRTQNPLLPSPLLNQQQQTGRN